MKTIKPKHKPRMNIFLVSLFTLLFSGALLAQPTITTDNSAPFVGAAGTEFDIVLTTDGVGVPYVEWKIYWAGSGGDPTSWLSGSSTNQTLTLTATPPEGIEGTFLFKAKVDDEPAGDDPNDAEKQFTIQIRKPVDVIFCVDISGSMRLNADPACTSDCPSRLDVLKASFDLLIDTWEATNTDVLNTHDNIGIVFFSTDADSPDNLTLGALSDEAGNAKLIVNDQDPTGSTAIGAALQKAVSQMPPDPNRSQNIILFTDGEQNRNPMVDPSTLEIKNDPSKSPSDAEELGVTIGEDDAVPASHIKIYTLGIGSNSAKALLDDIASATGVDPALLMDENDFTDDLPESYINQLLDILRAGSPQIAMHQSARLSGTSGSESVSINNDADKIVFMLYGKPTDELNFSVKKDGKDMTRIRSAEWKRGSSHTIYKLDLPAVTTQGDTIKSGGQWTMEIKGGAGENARYQAWAIVEEKQINYEASIGKKRYQVGDNVDLNLNLDHLGSPIDDAEVTVRVLLPGDDLGHLMATTSAPSVASEPLESQLTNAQNKYNSLIIDPSIIGKLKSKQQVVTLTNDGNGSYSGDFGNTELTGAYKFIFQIKGNHPEAGDIERVVTKSTMINFGKIKLESSDLKTVLKGSTVLSIQIKPKNEYGYLMGPGLSDHISISSNVGSIGQPVDNLDGTYSFPVTGINRNDDAVFTVSIFDETVFEGEVRPDGPVERNEFLESIPWWVWILLIVLLIILLKRRNKK